MLTLDEALGRLLAHARRTDGETVALADALGRVLVEPKVVATVDVPPFANSAMDGYAVRSTDTPGRLQVVGESAAGARDVPDVGARSAVAIATGAPLPAGADAVVPIEQVDELDGAVVVPERVHPGAHVRAAGHDTAAGDELCLRGELTPARIAVLASLGLGRVEVRRRPRVAILSTGDELVAPGEPLGPGRSAHPRPRSRRPPGWPSSHRGSVLARVPDQAVPTEEAMIDAARRGDLVVTSGGVSVGRRDHVRGVLERHGSLDFWRIAVQPGKPLAVGTLDGAPVIGLPGNPVSALVTFELFVRPFIRTMLDLGDDGRVRVRATPTQRMAKDPTRRAFLRVIVSREDGAIRAAPAGGQASSQLRPMAGANALLVVPEGSDAADPSETYEAIVLAPIPLTSP